MTEVLSLHIQKLFTSEESGLLHLEVGEAMGGKSGLFFYKTMDDQLVLKQMSRFEYLAFLDFPSLSRSMKFLD